MSVPSNLVPTRILQLPEDPSPSDTGWMMYVNNGVTYKVQVNAVLNVSGVPTSRVVAAGTGLTGGGALSSNITISVAPGGIGATQLDNTGVTAGVYGDSSNYPVITVDANGRVTAATELAFPSVSGYVPTSRQVIAGVGLSGGGALSTNVTLDANLSDANPQSVGAEDPGTSDDISRADHVHPAIDLADTQQTVNELDITRGGTGTALTAPANGGIVYSDGNSLQVSTAGLTGQVLASTGAGAPTWATVEVVSPVPANTVRAGPTSGSAADPTYRALVNADLPNSGVSATTYGSASAVPVIAVNNKGVITSAATTTIAIGNANLQYSAIAIGATAVSLGGTITTFAGVSISGSTNTLTNIPNSALTNSLVTIGSSPLSLGGTLTTLAGVSISGATNTLTAIPNASLDNSSITINGNTVALGGSTTVTATASNALTIGTGLSGTSYNGSAPVTIAIDSTVATLTGVQTLTNKTLTTPLVNDTLEINSSAVTGYTPFADSLLSMASNENNFQIAYGVNLNNGSDASFDFVAYNDASDVNSYFVDMGMNSSNYTSTTYPIFTPNSGYLFTGGGTSGQAADLFIGTSNPASDLKLFTGDVLTSSVRATIKGNTGNFLLGTATDTGYGFNNAGTSYLGGAATFGSTVTLNADPTLALQAATKQYVDTLVASGIHFHQPVRAATTTNLATIYDNGTAGVGATLTADTNRAFTTLDGVTGWSLNQRVLVKDQTAPAQNGIYTLTALGSTGVSPWVLTRATDADTYEISSPNGLSEGSSVYVESGTVNSGDTYSCNTVGTITFGTTAITFTLISGSINYTGGTNIDITGEVISLTGTVAATNGGTGTNTVAVGDLLYGSATDTWSKLALGTAYKSLVINASGTQVEWNAVALNQATAVSGQLGVSNGGTGQSSFTDGQLLIGNSTGNTLTKSTLTAGTGIDITNGSGTITITANISGGTF